MAVLQWDKTGERVFETGVDHGVLYLPDTAGAYPEGHAWNGLTTVTESPSGAESNKQYADNRVYANLVSAEEFGGTIEAFTYPDEFEQCDGTATPTPGVGIGQQTRRPFGLSYRNLIGNDTEGQSYGYKLHLVYGATAAPSEKARATVNDSPEAMTLSWEFTTDPVEVGTIAGVDYKPTSHITIDSTKVDAGDLATLEEFLYGTAGTDPSLPSPQAVYSIFSGTVLSVTPTEPAYDTTTNVMTVPTIAGVQYYMDDELLAPGAQPAFTANHVVEARPAPGYKFTQPVDSDWLIGDF